MSASHSADMKAFMSGKGIGMKPVGGTQAQPALDWLAQHEPSPSYRNIGGTEYKVSRKRVEVGVTHYVLTALVGPWPETGEAQLLLFYTLDGGTIQGGEIQFLDDTHRTAKVRVWTD